MPIRIYWPDYLLKVRDENENLLIIAMKREQTDYMVLSLVKDSKFKTVSVPYFKIGRYLKDGIIESFIDDKYSIIEFTPPKLNLMQFFSLEPISLILREKELGKNSSFPEKTCNYRKLLNCPTKVCSNNKLRNNLNLINVYYKHLGQFQKEYPHYYDKKKKKNRVKKFSRFIGSSLIFRIISQLIICIIILTRFISGNISKFLSCMKVSSVQLSATTQQIDLRCQQICYIPVQYMRIHNHILFKTKGTETLKSDKSDHSLISENNTWNSLPCQFYPDYIRLYNTLWLMVNDISFGMTVGTLLYENRSYLSHMTHSIMEKALYTGPLMITRFLDNNPFGIKLNGELSKFLSDLFLWIIEFSYTTYLKWMIEIETLHKFIIFMSQISSIFGATFSLALLIDLISFSSLHLTIFYFISAKIYYWQISVMRTLFYFFCGKKRNILRKRIDNNVFQLDQLLMGTLLFIVLIFLLPTVFAFYVTYTIQSMLLIGTEIVLELLMALLNHFPLFVLLLRLKDPKRLPGGIYMDTKEDHYVLQNNPLKLSMMFRPYFDLLHMMRNNFLSSDTFKQILTGTPIIVHRNELYQVLYSSLPTKPIDITLLWQDLQSMVSSR